MRHVDVDTRTPHRGAGQHLDAGDARARAIPHRAAAHQRKALGDLLAAGPERGAAPQIDHQRARHLAMGLEVEADYVVGRESAKLHGGRRRQEARIGGVEIASGGQHVAPSALRCAGRPGRYTFAVERRDQRVALGGGAALPQRIVAAGLAPIDMQPVLDREVFQVAQPGIDLAQRLVGVNVAADAGLARKPGIPRFVDDEARQPLAPSPVEPVGDGIFVDQPFQLLCRTGQLAAHERRWQMADGHRGDAALGLRRFARVRDDERVDHRQPARPLPRGSTTR